jgi:hypothetical protein
MRAPVAGGLEREATSEPQVPRRTAPCTTSPRSSRRSTAKDTASPATNYSPRSASCSASVSRTFLRAIRIVPLLLLSRPPQAVGRERNDSGSKRCKPGLERLEALSVVLEQRLDAVELAVVAVAVPEPERRRGLSDDVRFVDS